MLPLKPPITPMLAKIAATVPRGEGWVYEPKWDGFRGIVFIDGTGAEPYICSRNGQPLQRYFPELGPAFNAAFPEPCVVDGEIIIAGKAGLDFDALQMRLHPAASRVKMLAEKTPARFVAFDILARADRDLKAEPFTTRRAELLDALVPSDMVSPTPQTTDPDEAESWFERYEGAGCDGVVAKRADGRYLPGERAMAKIKHRRTIDCVVGGYRPSTTGSGIGSLLLGLYDGEGALQFVGHTSSFSAAERREVLEKLRPLAEKPSFEEGRIPGSPSRWSAGKDTAWSSVKPVLVCEISFEKMQGPRFRHAARFLRWRTDKDPKDCDFAQLEPPEPFDLDRILKPVG